MDIKIRFSYHQVKKAVYANFFHILKISPFFVLFFCFIMIVFTACTNPWMEDLLKPLMGEETTSTENPNTPGYNGPYAPGGPGTITPISTATELTTVIRNNLSGNYELNNDITLPANWTPIGTSDNPFTGSFNGNGHTVTVNGFDFAASGTTKGLFGNTEGANIEDLTINMNVSQTVNSSVNRERVGSISGYDEDSTFSRVTVTGNVNLKIDQTTSSTRIYLAGIVSSCRRSTFENCYVDVNLTLDANTDALAHVGGITNLNELSGSSDVVVIRNCLYAGSINVDKSRGTSYATAGGILGQTHSSVTTNITNCAVVSPSLVYKANSTYGSVQRIVSKTDTLLTVSGCVANSSMTVTKNGTAVTITNNANDIDGASKTSAELLQQSTYSGWDFVNIWKMGAAWPQLR